MVLTPDTSGQNVVQYTSNPMNSYSKNTLHSLKIPCIKPTNLRPERARGQGAAANAWGDHDTRSESQSGGNLSNGGKGKN